MRRRQILYDVSRLATRFSRAVPNGIDRVDIAYAEAVLSGDGHAQGVLLGPLGPRAIDEAAARAIVAAIGAHWREDGRADADPAYVWVKSALAGKAGPAPEGSGKVKRALGIATSAGRLLRRTRVLGSGGLFPARSLVKTAPQGAAYLNVSQFPVFAARYFRWLDKRPDLRAVFFVHDLLPLKYPEFFPPLETRVHGARLEVLARYAAGLIVSGEETKSALALHLKTAGKNCPPICVEPLPVSSQFTLPATPDPELQRHCYFVSLGTIEPRKNHLMLLQIWRELAERLGPGTPKLVLVGTRGWDNENVLDMLERGGRVRQHVIEAGNLSTPGLRSLLAGAQALLMPSFAEGYGLPVAEACAAGVPVIASGLPCFRQIESPGLVCLDCLDGPGWREAILAQMGNPRSNAGLAACEKSSVNVCDWSHIRDFIASI